MMQTEDSYRGTCLLNWNFFILNLNCISKKYVPTPAASHLWPHVKIESSVISSEQAGFTALSQQPATNFASPARLEAHTTLMLSDGWTPDDSSMKADTNKDCMDWYRNKT